MRSIFAVLLSLIFLTLTACQSNEEIVSNLSQFEANEIVVILESQKIDAQKIEKPGRVVSYAVAVKSGKLGEALKLLVDNKLPREKSVGLAEVYPVGGQGLIPTRTEEKARQLMALQGEVENMIKILPGVVQARVAIVLPDVDVVRDVNEAGPKPSASVAIVYNILNGQDAPSFKADDVKHLVASAVEGLTASNVTVLLSRNVPTKLVSVNGVVVSTTPVPKDSKIPIGKELEYKQSVERSYVLVWLFGVLAVLGLALGIFGILRSLGLRSRLIALEQATPPPELAGAQPPVPPPAG